MEQTTKNKISFLVLLPFLLCWGILCLSLILREPADYSESERRKLAEFPEITLSSLSSGRHASLLEDYVRDQFPFRDDLRSLATLSTHTLYGRTENNGYLFWEDHLILINYPLDYASLERAANHFSGIYNTYLAETDCNIYFSIIPEKNHYLMESGSTPVLPYEEMEAYFTSQLPFAQFVSIVDTLTADSYYYTDTHWRQETLLPTANTLLSAMISSHQTMEDYEILTPLSDFQGVLCGNAGYYGISEDLSYLNAPHLETTIVSHLENGKATTIYDETQLSGADPYSFFLSGSSAFLTMENPDSDTDKELILFRDSFGSSIAPLLLEEYAKITLIDTRYIPASLIGDYVDFENQDVLFLYSTMLLNDSVTLK